MDNYDILMDIKRENDRCRTYVLCHSLCVCVCVCVCGFFVYQEMLWYVVMLVVVVVWYVTVFLHVLL